jgi:hypothetical protein
MVTILDPKRVANLPALGINLVRLLDDGGLVARYRAEIGSAAISTAQLEAALFVFICSCARLRSLSADSKVSLQRVEDIVFAMLESVCDGNRLVRIGEWGLSDFEQSQVIIALETLFGSEMSRSDEDLRRAIERFAVKFGELMTARVHVGTAALAKALKAVGEKTTSADDRWHLALTEISMDINRGLKGCPLTTLAADPAPLRQWHDTAFFGTSVILL